MGSGRYLGNCISMASEMGLNLSLVMWSRVFESSSVMYLSNSSILLLYSLM